jgi:hypothetical protein
MGNVNYEETSDTSKISTEIMVDDDPLLDMDVNYAALSYLLVYVGTIQSCNNEKTTHDVSLQLNNEVEDPIYITSPISTETLVDNNSILDIDATPKKFNKEVKIKKIQVMEHDTIVRSEMSSMFKTAHYQSEESRAIIHSKMIMEAFPPNNFASSAFNSIINMITMPKWLSCPMYIATKTKKSTSSTKCNYPGPPKMW